MASLPRSYQSELDRLMRENFYASSGTSSGGLSSATSTSTGGGLSGYYPMPASTLGTSTVSAVYGGSFGTYSGYGRVQDEMAKPGKIVRPVDSSEVLASIVGLQRRITMLKEGKY